MKPDEVSDAPHISNYYAPESNRKVIQMQAALVPKPDGHSQCMLVTLVMTLPWVSHPQIILYPGMYGAVVKRIRQGGTMTRKCGTHRKRGGGRGWKVIPFVLN